jgi:uncharacterized membrane protein YfcA
VEDGLSLVAVSGIGVVAGTIGAMVGGGSLLSIPLLIFLGLPAPVAIATDRFAGLGAACTAGFRYWRAGEIVWRWVPWLGTASLVGSLVGANLLVRTDAARLEPIIGLLLLLLLPALFLRPAFGVETRDTSRSWRLAGFGLYFAIQLLTGYFGAGTGPLVFTTLMMCFGLTIVQAVATQVVPFLLLTVASVLVFGSHGIIDYRMGIALLLGTAIGGSLGAKLAIEKGAGWVRRVFAGIVALAALRLILA